MDIMLTFGNSHILLVDVSHTLFIAIRKMAVSKAHKC